MVKEPPIPTGPATGSKTEKKQVAARKRTAATTGTGKRKEGKTGEDKAGDAVTEDTKARKGSTGGVRAGESSTGITRTGEARVRKGRTGGTRARKDDIYNGTEKKASRRKNTRKSARKKASAESANRNRFPEWLNYIFMGIMGIAFLAGFYSFFIRPYAYRWKPCYGFKAYGVCIPSGYSIHGFDVSHHQGNIRWRELEKTQHSPFPIHFVFMKASEGGDFGDSTFQRNFDSARVHGFIRGAYHFYNPKTDPNRQADFFIRSVKLKPGDLPPVLDIETRSSDMDRLRNDLKIWLKKIEQHYQIKPILYTSYKFKTRYLNDSVFNSYPYWIAHYYVDSVRYEGQWKFWQHTDVGQLPGIDERVDLNVFHGSLEELKAMTIPQTSSDEKTASRKLPAKK